MRSGFDLKLRNYAEVIVRVGLNLQPGQRLLIAEPYELHGISPSSAPLVAAIASVVEETTGGRPGSFEIIRGSPERLREYVVRKDWNGLAQLVAANAAKMNGYVQCGDALLFLLDSQPGLMSGIPAIQVAEARRIGAEHFGAVAQRLMQGATNWTAAPTPSPDWADLVYPRLMAERRLPALWETLFKAMRIEDTEKNLSARETIEAWRIHLQELKNRRDDLNAKRYESLNYRGEGTNLTVTLPHEHLWCTANLRSRSGIDFVANLPTEEVFTLPHRESAHGTVRIVCPVTFGGATIDGIELEFRNGRVINATARKGEALLIQLLETDPGACRLGEVALAGEEIPSPNPAKQPTPAPWTKDRPFHHVLLDENAGSHIALGEGYGFCLRLPNSAALNRSMIHVDLPIAAKAHLIS